MFFYDYGIHSERDTNVLIDEAYLHMREATRLVEQAFNYPTEYDYHDMCMYDMTAARMHMNMSHDVGMRAANLAAGIEQHSYVNAMQLAHAVMCEYMDESEQAHQKRSDVIWEAHMQTIDWSTYVVSPACDFEPMFMGDYDY